MADEKMHQVFQLLGVKDNGSVTGVERIQESYNPAADINKSLNPATSLFGTIDLPSQNADSGNSIWDTIAPKTPSKKD